MKALAGWVSAACILALGIGPANAIAITETINFTASGFAGAPIEPVIGSFTGYCCQGYSDAVAWPKKGSINLCEPGKETIRMHRALH